MTYYCQETIPHIQEYSYPFVLLPFQYIVMEMPYYRQSHNMASPSASITIRLAFEKSIIKSIF